jgi:hypothetical protein
MNNKFKLCEFLSIMMIGIIGLTGCEYLNQNNVEANTFSGSEEVLSVPIDNTIRNEDLPTNVAENITSNNATEVKTEEQVVVPEIILRNAEINGINIKPGVSGEFEITLTNTSDKEINVAVSFTEPYNLRDGYSYVGVIASKWIEIYPVMIQIMPKSNGHSIVKVKIPDDATLPEGNLEFWLAYKYSTGGFVNYTLNQRWLLNRGEY